MFYCNGCKRQFDGEPSRKTGKELRIKWCLNCDEGLKQKFANAMKQRAIENANKNECVWCHDKLTEGTRAKSPAINEEKSYNVNLCIDCQSHSEHRKWLEKCLTTGPVEETPHILKYLSGAERLERWRSIRVENERKHRADEVAQLPLMPIDSSDMEMFQQFKAFMAMMKNNGSK